MRPRSGPGLLGPILDEVPVVGIVRTEDEQSARDVARRLLDRGIRAVEVSLTTPGAFSAIRTLAAERPEGVAIGVGTVRTAEELERSIEVGAEFIVTPTVIPEVIGMAVARGLPTVIGACTPTEVQVAVEAGASFVKLFPASQWSIASFRDLRAVFADVPFVPTGGVRLDEAPEWILSGAVAVGLGSALSDPEADLPTLLGRLVAARSA
jgi:2-dehydro-3-deoxyphosphogluconate aldolase/(4S)-4-hydroxy-2-oxoglutarate aldolase